MLQQLHCSVKTGWIGAGKKLWQSQLRTGCSRHHTIRRFCGGAWGRGHSSRGLLLNLTVPAGLTAYHVLKPPCLAVAACKQQQQWPVQRLATTASSVAAQPQLNWTRFLALILPDAILLLVAVASAVVAALLNISIPLELGRLINSVARLEQGQEVWHYLRQLAPNATKLVSLYACQAIATFVYITVLSVAGERLAARIRQALFKAIIIQDIEFFDSHKTGELVSRLSGDVQELKSSFKMVISQGLRSVTQVVGCVASLFFISPQMTGIVGVALPVMVAIGTGVGSVLRKWSRKAQEQIAVATGVADEAISNVRTVRAFSMEENEERLYGWELQQAHQTTTWLGVGVAVFQALSNLAINGIVLAVVGHGGLLLASNQVSPGNLMAFLVATQTIQRSLGSLSVLFGQVVRGLSAGGRVFEFMEREPTVSLHGGVVLPTSTIRGAISFHNVTFAYPSRPDQDVLNGLDLELPAGRVTALCGLSGAGKSTIAALVERFYEPQVGVVKLDGHVLSTLNPSWLRGEVLGYISQEPVLFGCSVLENIRYGNPAATDQQVVEAAQLAYAHQFIQEFPDGYSTLVGERGVALSGGQKQRVAIARALLKNPPILILDEATSALDAQSESLVQKALDRACEGRTVLIIAHRLSTIRGADQIAVIHKGALKEVGSHEALVKKGGLYSELIRRQTEIN